MSLLFTLHQFLAPNDSTRRRVRHGRTVSDGQGLIGGRFCGGAGACGCARGRLSILFIFLAMEAEEDAEKVKLPPGSMCRA